MLLLTILVTSLGYVNAQCKDGPLCNELMNVRFPFVASSYKCSLWVFSLAPELFPAEIKAAAAQRTMVMSYCPVSCNSCPKVVVPTTTTKTTIKATVATTTTPTTTTTTQPTTTAPPEQRLQEIMNNNWQFKELLQGLDVHVDGTDGLERYALYVESKKQVDEHNTLFEQGKTQFKMAMNTFSIAKPEEIAPNALLLDFPPTPLSDADRAKAMMSSRRRRQSETVDWRPHMKEVTDQKKCGGCWAFAMNAMVEGFLSSKGQPTNDSLAVQQLLDCDRTVSSAYGLANQGCAGGYFQVAADYLSQKGITSAAVYPFAASSTGTCALSTPAIAPRIKTFDSGYVSAGNVSDIVTLTMAMEARVRKGPVAVGMAVGPEVYAYGQGVFDGACGDAINHAVVLVGFTADYWIIRNSWGASWGESGYIRVARRNGSDPCHLVQYWARASAIGTMEPAPATPKIPIISKRTYHVLK